MTEATQRPENSAGLSTPVLSDALEAARAEAERIRQQMAELDRKLAAIIEEARLLERILSLRSGGETQSLQTASTPETGALRSGATQLPGGTSSPVIERVVAALETAKRPIHVQELMRALVDGAVRLPGAGKQANLIGLMRRDPRITRPTRGMYALADWGVVDMPTGSRRRRKTRRRRGKMN